MWTLDDKELFSKTLIGALRTKGIDENSLSMIADEAKRQFNPNEENTVIDEIIKLRDFLETWNNPVIEMPEPHHMTITLTIPVNGGASIAIALDTFFPQMDEQGQPCEYPQSYIDLVAGNLFFKAVSVSKHIRNVAPMMLSKPGDTQSMPPAIDNNHPKRSEPTTVNVNQVVNNPKKVTKLSVKPAQNNPNFLVRRLHGDWFSQHGLYLDKKCKIEPQFAWINTVDAGEYDIDAQVIDGKNTAGTSVILQVF